MQTIEVHPGLPGAETSTNTVTFISDMSGMTKRRISSFPNLIRM